MPQLPDLGGCGCHDACNCLKKGTNALHLDLMQLWKALFPCLEKASVKKSLHYALLCGEVGLAYRHSPKFLEVRFRYCILMAVFFEENNRAIYKYFGGIVDTYKDTGKLPSENESTVINIFLKDYIHVRLYHMFIIDAGDLFLKFIEFFEKRSITMHLMFAKTVILLSTHLSFFLKDGDRERLSARQLLEVDYKKPEMQLHQKDIYVGLKARNFMQKMGFSSQSPELAVFFKGVRDFYHASTAALLKYCKITITNPFVSALRAIQPESKEELELPVQRGMWDTLATQLCHIVDKEAKNTLLTEELVAYQRLTAAPPGCEVDEWWAEVAKVQLGGESQFPILSKLALACCTIAGSSSEAEREFSAMSDVYANSKVTNLSQELLDAKMMVKCAAKAEAKNCARCIAHDEERKEKEKRGEHLSRAQTQHCHCSFLEVDDDMLAGMRTHQPSKMHEEEKKENRLVNEEERKRLEKNRVGDAEEAERDLKREVAELKKRYQEKRVQVIKEGGDVTKMKVPQKRIGIEKVTDEEKARKKMKLDWVFDASGQGGSREAKSGSTAEKRGEKSGSGVLKRANVEHKGVNNNVNKGGRRQLKDWIKDGGSKDGGNKDEGKDGGNKGGKGKRS